MSLDPELQVVVDLVNAQPAPPAAEQGAETLRAAFAVLATMLGPGDEGVATEDLVLDLHGRTVSARRYLPAEPAGGAGTGVGGGPSPPLLGRGVGGGGGGVGGWVEAAHPCLIELWCGVRTVPKRRGAPTRHRREHWGRRASKRSSCCVWGRVARVEEAGSPNCCGCWSAPKT